MNIVFCVMSKIRNRPNSGNLQVDHYNVVKELWFYNNLYHDYKSQSEYDKKHTTQLSTDDVVAFRLLTDNYESLSVSDRARVQWCNTIFFLEN